ncbi:polysaccharide biosynthesis protein [Nafulsella turpanensis]|uniref:hypothetical protein n=1 Tax=Nafulsella turpanensis TaxID=1265690 RepID=UPI00037520B9|nr:hypothetical protein [Nafulsella turpanensis]
MKSLAQRIYTHPNFERVLGWGKLLTITGSTQVLVQAIGFISGIIIIRTLSTHEYALYTLANTTLGAMIILADGGISTGVMAQGGKVWQDHAELGKVLSTGSYLKKKFAIGSLLLAVPPLFFLFRHHGTSWGMSVLITLSLIPAFYTTLSNQLLEIAPKLRQDILPLQKVQLGANVGRVVILGLTLFAFPWAFIALIAYGLPQVWGNMHIRRSSKKYADHAQKPDPAVRKEILFIVKRKLPEAIYYCIGGQITIWLLSIFGSTTEIAQIGGLGRLAVVINSLSVLFGTLILPRFARLPNEPKVILLRFFQIQVGLVLLNICLVFSFWIFSTELLWILGPDYAGLSTELLLNTVAACLSVVSGASFFLCLGRGWIINPLISIPLNVMAIICGALIFDVSSLKGILMMNIFIAAVQVIMNSSYSYMKILKSK